MSTVLLDAAGRRRSPATMPGFHTGRPPRNKGRRYPADPPKVEEIVAVMRQAGTTPHGLRMRGLIVVLWRAGLRIHEALALTEADLDARRGSVLVRRGKGGRRRAVGMDDWAWAREGVPLIVIQRQLGHTNLGITSIYLQGIDSAEIIDTVHARRAPVVPVSSTLRP
jgi:site-specific recombinase XerD